MKIRTIIVDDEPIALQKLKSYVEKVPFLELVGAFSSAIDALTLLHSTEVDVIFTDIEMPDLDGIDFIASLTPNMMVVFTTAYSEYAVESYRFNSIDYLLKPYGFAEFQRAANKVARQYTLMNHDDSHVEKTNHIFIKVDSRWRKVDFSKILYIKGYGEYLQVYTADVPSPLITLSSFADMMSHLPEHFLQVHRSYIVNMDQVMRVEKMRIVLPDETIIPVSDSYRARFLDYIHERSVGSGHK